MKEKILRKMKKCLSEIIVFAMLITMIPSFPAMAEQGKTYTYEDLEIQYLVTSEWESGQNVEITVKNTGAESVFNWAFLYDAKGEITNIWNADIAEKEGNSYVIRNVNHNFEIASGQSVNFGYTLTPAENGFPEKFELCSKREQMESGYNVKMAVTESWDAGFKGEIVIENTSEQPLEAWDLTFDTNFIIDNLWDARIIESTDNHYKIASEMWTNPIPSGESVKIGFVAASSEGTEASIENVVMTSVLIDYEFEKESEVKPEVKGVIDLSTDETEIPAEPGNKTVFFYAHTEMVVPSITLVDKESGQGVGTFTDDGDYSFSGDDMKGDGVYTCKAEIDISKGKDYIFCAEYEDIISEPVEISVFEGFTDQENGEMDEVDAVLSAWLSGEGFKELPLAEKEKQGFSILKTLATEGTKDYSYELIREDTIYYNSDVHGYFFTYACGVLGSVFLEECEDGCNGVGGSERGGGMDLREKSLKSTLANTVKKTNPVQVLYAFREDERYRYAYYEQYKKEWKSMGVNTEIDDKVTVSDFKNKLKGKSVVVFSMHGGYYSYINSKKKEISVPALFTRDKVTKKKNDNYKKDLDKHRIGRTAKGKGGYYVILPGLFSSTYKKKPLKGSVVFMENCSGFGYDAGKDDTLAQAIKKGGAKFIMGFHGSVDGAYSREMLRTFVLAMTNGTTTGEAFKECVLRCGMNDREYKKIYPNPEDIAYPVWYGDTEFTLWKGGLLKGSFEKEPEETEEETLQGWIKEGDVRTVTMLGELTPVDGSYMAILTTGIGSGEEEYLGESVGSTMSQRFKVPEGAKHLSFSYNVVSEEPMEYVGSKYDDTFSAKIYNADGDEYKELAHESVNTADWRMVSGVDFAGGDHTAYQTGWKTVEFDVSSYCGQYVTLSFEVWDEGDSAFDTAVLIDNVNIQGVN